MTFTHGLSTNNYGSSKFIVSTNAAEGTHTTLAAAQASASNGDTIFIRTDITEDLVVTKSLRFVGISADGSSPSVTVTGKFTISTAITVSFVNLQMTKASDFFLVVDGSSTSVVNLCNCYLNCSNNTGISYTSSGASSKVNVYSCQGNLATTGIKLFESSGSGQLTFNYCDAFTNTGGSTTASTISAGVLQTTYSVFAFPIETSGTAACGIGNGTFISTAAQNATCLTLGGSGGHSVTLSSFSSGTASAISTATAVNISLCSINSTNTNPITGAGTSTISDISFINSGFGVNTTTSLENVTRPGITLSTKQPLFTAANTAVTNVTGDGTTYAVIYDSEITDQSASYNPATGVFTAPYTANYLFTASVVLGELAAGNTAGSMRIVTTARTVTLHNGNYGAFRNSGNIMIAQGSIILPMTAGNTAYIDVTVSGGAAVVDVDANGYFTGTLLA